MLKPSRRWESRHKGYLLPVKALSKRFRGLMVSALRTTRHSGGLATREFDQTLDRLMTKPWCVYSKSAVRYRETLVEYLARYSHRIGLSNHRLLSWENGQITLAYHDYRTTKDRRLRLTPEELLRRFLLHVLPKGFMRIRHYGFLANAIKQRSLALIRRQLPQRNTRQKKTEQTPQNRHGAHCPHCGHHPVLCLGDQHTAPLQAIHLLTSMQRRDSS
ncbi:transposase [Salinispirillum marinum]|uniref:Transposase n=2 Tax=Saccharospirillaceae TaxID=255527 RepID=A0ABV8BJM2_9GAMM